MMTMAFSTQRPPKGRLAFQAHLAVVDHKAHGYTDKISWSCVDRKDAGGNIMINVLFTNSPDIDRGNAPDAREQWEPLSL